MKKHLPSVSGVVLGLVFLFASVSYFLKLFPAPTFPEGTPIAMFMGAMIPTGYMTVVKVFELLGGILVLIPKTRNFGLLILIPILVNIVTCHVTIMGAASLANPMLIVAIVAAAHLVWDARGKIAGLAN
jgi:uncharacterized membrane protein YphA (DoxX/SURF4 family)